VCGAAVSPWCQQAPEILRHPDETLGLAASIIIRDVHQTVNEVHYLGIYLSRCLDPHGIFGIYVKHVLAAQR
jgi:hypothetical protein